jgi:hypothetical protein
LIAACVKSVREGCFDRNSLFNFFACASVIPMLSAFLASPRRKGEKKRRKKEETENKKKVGLIRGIKLVQFLSVAVAVRR